MVDPKTLTKTEYDLPELFVSHPDEVLSREFVRKRIRRGSQLYSQSRTVGVHIQRLRKKLEKDPNNRQYILTVAGVGYRYGG